MGKVKSAAQVKRKLDFRELPLRGKTFYLDLRSDVAKNKVARRISELGGKVETFLTREIHLLVTDRNGESNAQKGQRGKNETSTQGDPSSLIQTKLSFPLSRGKALLLKATQTSEGSMCSSTVTTKDAVQNAQNLGVKVEHFTKFLKDCNKLLQKLKQLSPVYCGDTKTELDKDFTPINWKHESRLVLKVEDSNTFFKPIFKEFDKPLKINYNGDYGSPFAEGIILKRPEVRENRYSIRKKSQNVAPKGGFCEACDNWYSCNLREHLLSDHHQEYVSNQKNFSSLKNIVNEMPSFDTFISKYKSVFLRTASSMPYILHTCEKNNPKTKAGDGLKSQPVGFSTDSLSGQQVAIAEIINKLDDGAKHKSQTEAKQNALQKHSSNDISWDSGVNHSSNSVPNTHSNDVHMQTVIRQAESCRTLEERTIEQDSGFIKAAAVQITDVRKKLMSCSLEHQSEGSVHGSDKTEEYEVFTNVIEISSELNKTVVSVHNLPGNEKTTVLHSSSTEEYECTQNIDCLFTSSQSEETEHYDVLENNGGVHSAKKTLSFTLSQSEDNTEDYELSQRHYPPNALESLAKRLDETNEFETDVLMKDESLLQPCNNSDIENVGLDKDVTKSFKKSSNTVRSTCNSSLLRPFSNITNVWSNTVHERSSVNRSPLKQLDNLYSVAETQWPLKLKLTLSDNKMSCPRKRKLSIEDDKIAPIYYSCKANGTKLKICKVVTPVHRKADLRQYWKVRKAGGCRLVFSTEKQRENFQKSPPLQNACSPVVKRRKCLF